LCWRDDERETTLGDDYRRGVRFAELNNDAVLSGSAYETVKDGSDTVVFFGNASDHVRFHNELRAPDFGVSFDVPHPLTEGCSNRGVMEPLRADLRESVNTVPSGGSKAVDLSSEGSLPSPTVLSLHNEAMALADEADAANRARAFEKAADLYDAAWKKESAAWSLALTLGADRVTREVLKESADALYQCGRDAHERFMNGGIKVMPAVQPLEDDDD
jgi:hypothetical protein